MKKSRLHEFLLQFKGCEQSFPFGPETSVFKVMGKTFTLVSEKEHTPRVTLKCPPEYTENLVDEFESIVPSQQIRKKHWITIALTDEVPDALVSELVSRSYTLVKNQLTRADISTLERRR